ncbi:MAG: cadmium-translocating P-type ATPase [Oscillospiraceae bacterium]|nr:cadmium-translocating P-type ATPase [Oscillospiraceae bacterium]
MNKKQKKMLLRIVLSAALLCLLLALPLEGWLRFALFLIPYLIVGYDILIEAFEGIRNGQPFDENFLMAVATVGALALGEYTEGVAVMLLYQTGELFQSYAVGKSRRSIGALMDIRPDSAKLLGEDGEIRTVDPDEVEIGSIIVVRPGEKIPLDGVIVKGKSSLDTAALTGESIPREVKEGSEVISGCINLSGLIEIRTTKDFGESTVSKILDLVENATSRKSKSENFISKFARVYTPAVCFGALALFLLPPLVSLLLGREAQWSVWLYRALTFLVISCPCALVISIPLSFFAGIGGASANGILIKGSNFMETLSEVRTVVLDKTGTLTEGNFEVSGVHHSTIEDEKLIEYAAHAEIYSSHPISRSLVRAYGREPDAARVSDVREESGRGVIARVDGREVAVGSAKLMRSLGCEPIDCSHVGTIVHVAIDGSYAGHILIEDLVKEGAQDAIEGLRRSGVKKIVMLTGDVRSVAEDVAGRLKLDEVKSELLPADKVGAVEELLAAQPEKEKLAFVGDGINDAPVLARADIGIAMGGLGSDAAIEAADVVLMDDKPGKIAKAIRISRKCLRIVKENIWFAIAVKLLCLALGALGLAGMWAAIFADVGVMVIAVLNALRALHVKNL